MGFIPKWSLKALEKCDTFLKPVIFAIVLIGKEVFCINKLARLRRLLVKYLKTVLP